MIKEKISIEHLLVAFFILGSGYILALTGRKTRKRIYQGPIFLWLLKVLLYTVKDKY